MNIDPQTLLGLAGALVGMVLAGIGIYYALHPIKSAPPRPKCVMRIEEKGAVICAWCPDAKEGTAWAEYHGLMPTHTLCPACRDRFFPKLKRI